jgi:hypothetical protein
MILVLGVWTFLRPLLGRSTAVTLENVALRHQLMVLQRSSPRPRLRRQDRLLWVCLSRLWAVGDLDADEVVLDHCAGDAHVLRRLHPK